MSAAAALECSHEHARLVDRLFVDVEMAARSPRKRKLMRDSYDQRVKHEQEVWTAGLLRLSEQLHTQLDIDAAIAYALSEWRAANAVEKLWSAVRRAASPPGTPPNQQEVKNRLATTINEASYLQGAMQIYLGMATETGQAAGEMSLKHLGLNKTFAWAHPQNMASPLYAVRGSKVIQQMYGDHIDNLSKIITEATNPRNPMTLQEVRARVAEQWPALQRYQVDRIARTETAAVWTSTSMNAYAANGITSWESAIAQGPSIGVESEDPCDECVAAAAEVHSMDDDIPPWHPNCRCEVIPVLEDENGDAWIPPADPWEGGDLPVVDPTAEPPTDGMFLYPTPSPGETFAARAPVVGDAAGGLTNPSTEAEARAAIESAGNRISGLKTRIKKEQDLIDAGGGNPDKLNELNIRLNNEYRQRTEWRDRLDRGEFAPEPPLPPPPVISPVEPPGVTAPASLDGTEDTFNNLLHENNGKFVRFTYTSGQQEEGMLVAPREYKPLLNNRTLGNGNGVASIEVSGADGSWTTIALREVFPETPTRLKGTAYDMQNVLGEWKDRTVRITYPDGSAVFGTVTRNPDAEGWLVNGQPLRDPGSAYRVEVMTGRDYRTVAEKPLAEPPVSPPPPAVVPTPPAVDVAELKAKITSTRNKMSGLNTRLKRELEKAHPHQDTVDELRARLAAHKKDVEDWKAQIDNAGKQPPALPPVSPPPVSPVPAGLPVPAEVSPSTTAALDDPLVADINAIKAKADWISPQQAKQKGASLSMNGYDGHYSVPSGVAPYIEQQAAAVREAGARIDKEIEAELAKDSELHAEDVFVSRQSLTVIKNAVDNALQPFREANVAARTKWVEVENEVVLSGIRNGLSAPEARSAIYTNEEWKAAHEAWMRADDLLETARKEWDIKIKEARRIWKEAESAQAKAGRDATMRVVQRLRDFGEGEGASQVEFIPSVRRPGSPKGQSQKEAQASIKEAAQYYPTDWLTKTRPFDTGINSRGYHMDFWQTAVIRTTREATPIEGDHAALATSVHELAHEMESVNPLVTALEKQFYEYRTAGESLQKGMTGYGRGEAGRPDKFFSPYAGREYPGQKVYELLSMGLEDLWSGRGLMDPEYRQWVLGMLTLLP